jgi:ferrous iron transport protein B
MRNLIIGVVGNPNCGKTTLFNALTGAKQQVGNWPGVTVERKVGYYPYAGHTVEVVDLPGTYSLDAVPGGSSLDERIAQDYILSGEADLIVNIIDASNIERNLYLTTQLLEMKVPLVIAVNMMDIAHQRQITIDIKALSERLGTPIVPLIASKEQGIVDLKQLINEVSIAQQIPAIQVNYPPAVETAISQLLPHITPTLSLKKQAHARWITLKLLENDEAIVQQLGEQVNAMATQYRETIEEDLEEEVDILTADSRYTFISAVVEETVKKGGKIAKTVSDKIDQVVLNRTLGIPIFLVVMYLMFTFTINIGGVFIDFFDILVGTFFVEGLKEMLTAMTLPTWLIILLADGVGGGIQVVATFIPIIGFLFLFLSLLEDSGYMARAAFVMDRFMRFIGLPGKAFVPMIVGFGCNVPAIMATRTLENQRDRIMTITMNPFMSCGARLSVYALFAVAFFPTNGQNLVFSLYLIGIAVAVMTGLIMKNTLLRGEASPLVMELPPYHLPTVKSVLLRAWDRLQGFIFRAGKVIVPVVVIISFLNSLGTDGTYGNEGTNKSVLSEIGRTLTPVFKPMGIQEDNWPATVGIFTGILAKEVVVGTLDALYEQLARVETAQIGEKEAFDLGAGIKAAFLSIPKNITQLTDTIFDPLGLRISTMSDEQQAAELQGVQAKTFGVIQGRFEGQIGAFAYLLFILLYFPCIAATAAIYRETNAKWAVFIVTWSTSLAYLFAVIFYQLATFSQHPWQSVIWISSLVGLFSLVIVGFRILRVNTDEYIEI